MHLYPYGPIEQASFNLEISHTTNNNTGFWWGFLVCLAIAGAGVAIYVNTRKPTKKNAGNI